MGKVNILIIIIILCSAVGLAIDIPNLNSYVTDNADILSFEEESQLNDLASLIEKNTTVEIAIVTINSLEGGDIDQFAVELFEKNGIGKKDIDNGLLILIVPQDRLYRIEVGYGLEGTITDADSQLIGSKILQPAFSQGAYGLGLVQATNVVAGFVTNNQEVVSKLRSAQLNNVNSSRISLTIFALFFVLSIISSIANKKKGVGSFFFGGFGPGFNSGNFGSGFGGRGGFGGLGGGMSGGGGFSGKW